MQYKSQRSVHYLLEDDKIEQAIVLKFSIESEKCRNLPRDSDQGKEICHPEKFRIINFLRFLKLQTSSRSSMLKSLSDRSKGDIYRFASEIKRKICDIFSQEILFLFFIKEDDLSKMTF